MEIKGTVETILDIEKGTSKAGKEWQKQNFVINTGDQYNPLVCFSAFGDDKLEIIAKLKVGDDVNVHFNLSSREFNNKYYHDIQMWKVDSDNGITNDNSGFPANEEPAQIEDEEEMPF